MSLMSLSTMLSSFAPWAGGGAGAVPAALLAAAALYVLFVVARVVLRWRGARGGGAGGMPSDYAGANVSGGLLQAANGVDASSAAAMRVISPLAWTELELGSVEDVGPSVRKFRLLFPREVGGWVGGGRCVCVCVCGGGGGLTVLLPPATRVEAQEDTMDLPVGRHISVMTELNGARVIRPYTPVTAPWQVRRAACGLISFDVI